MGLMPPIGWMVMSKSIIGVNMLKIGDEQPEMISECLEKSVRLFKKGDLIVEVGGSYSIDQINEAHHKIESGKTMGKLSVYWG